MALQTNTARAQSTSATFLAGKMLHGEELSASAFGRTTFIADAVEYGLSSG